MAEIHESLKDNKSGASAVEYALIIAILGGFVVGGTTLFGGGLETALENAGTPLTSNGAADGTLDIAG